MKKRLSYLIFCLVIPTVVLGGVCLFRDRQYVWIYLCVAVLSCVPFFIHFEKSENDTRKLVLIAAMIALSVIGRIIFTPVPGFKPVTAITVITAMWLGRDAGFAVGALSAAVSNFYFGQGPWTPFQMLAWGLIGFSAGVLAGPMRKSRAALCVFGAAAGVMFSLLMDIWTVLWADGTFNLARYAAAVVSALPVTAEYAVSNVIFLLILANPIGEKLERMKKKYGLFVSA